MGLYFFKLPRPGCLIIGYASEVCFGDMLRGYASRNIKTKIVAFSEGIFQDMLRKMLRLNRISQSYIN